MASCEPPVPGTPGRAADRWEAPWDVDARAMVAATATLAVGAWLFLAPWVLDHARPAAIWSDVLFGLAVVALAVVGLVAIPAARVIGTLNAAAGTGLVVVASAVSDATAAYVNDIACGAALIALGVLTAHRARPR